MKHDVLNWLKSGANAQEGVQLMNRAGAPSCAVKVYQANPEHHRLLILSWLMWRFSLSPESVPRDTSSRQKSFRDEFPFLNSPDCPMELEALASRKFSRYHSYTELHAQLRSCSSVKECADKSRALLNSYMDNRLIWNELNYFQQHRSILGKHPIFAEFRRRREILGMSVRELMKRKKQLEDNIWRVNSELKKGNKPHLETERRARLDGYKTELADVHRLLGEDE